MVRAAFSFCNNSARSRFLVVSMLNRIAAVLLLLALSSASAYAQWAKLTNDSPFKSPSGQSGGAMTFNSGILWAGAKDVRKSLDFGLTWQTTSCPAGQVFGITFFDQLIGVVCMENDAASGGLYITNNGGASWRKVIDSIGVYDAAFGVTADTI